MSKNLVRAWRRILPIGLGALNGILVIWDVHNQRVILSMGMAWDMGAPLWPYQTPEILLWVLNTPAYFVALPIANLFALIVPQHYWVLYPTTVVWWWFVGHRIDAGLARSGGRSRWALSLLALVAAVALVWLGSVQAANGFRWWMRYADGISTDSALIMLRLSGPAAWCFALAMVALIVAKRLLLQKQTETPNQLS